jgi:hypothetical protein
MQTGRGIPSAFMQTNIGTGEDLKAQAKAKAEAEAKAKLAALGENKGDSKNVRNVEATATVTKEGKKVEKFAKTPAEIAAWKAAPKENKEKYLKQSATETVKLSDVGKDTPKPPETPKEEPKKYGTFYRQGTMGYGGARGYTSGFSTEGWQGQGDIANMEKKNEYDKAEIEGDLSHNRGLKRSSQNTFEKYDVTPEDDLMMRYGDASKMFPANRLSPYDNAWKDKTPEASAAKRAAFVSKMLPKAQEWEKKEAEKAAKKKPVAMQLKKKANSPAQMKVSKKTAYDIKEASNQKLKPSARKNYAENAQAAMKNKKTPAKMKKC